jgi:hypothetical protein
VRSEVDARQPTIRRENASMTNATYTNPRQMETYVRSATHSWFGRRKARNCQVTRSGGRAAAVSGLVVTVNRRPRIAWYSGSRLLEPLGYMPPAEFEKAYHDRQAAPVGMAVLT